MEKEISLRRESNQKSINFLIILVFFIIFISFVIYLFFIYNFKGYDITSTRFLAVTKKIKDIPVNSVFFLGDSQTREDIDCGLIFKKNNPCFNFGIEGISPLQLAFMSNLIAESKPKAVVLTVSPLFFSDKINRNNDLFFFINDEKLKYNNNLVAMLNKDEKAIIFMTPLDKVLYKRKFIMQFYLGVIKSIFIKSQSESKIGNFENPYLFNSAQSDEELKNKTEDNNITKLFLYDERSEREIKSFQYLVKSLSSSGIKVVIIEAPLNPLILEKIDNSSSESYFRLLKKIARNSDAAYLNYRNGLTSDNFNDLSHLNEKGREKFSPVILEVIEKNVI